MVRLFFEFYDGLVCNTFTDFSMGFKFTNLTDGDRDGTKETVYFYFSETFDYFQHGTKFYCFELRVPI